MNGHFSHSSLSTYEQCPAKYKFSYVDGIQKPQESIEAFVGRRVHETMEFLYTEVTAGKTPVYDTIAEDFHRRWQENWHPDIVFVKRRFSAEDHRSVAERCLAWYFRNYQPFDEPVVGVEVILLFAVGPHGEHTIKGIVDRLEHHGDGSWEIHDYKTSNRPMTQAEADRDRQLGLYHLGLKKTHEHVKDVRLVWHFLKTGETVRSTRSVEQLSRLESSVKKRIDQLTHAVDKRGPFPARESPLCAWCYYWGECPAKTGNNPFVKT